MGWGVHAGRAFAAACLGLLSVATAGVAKQANHRIVPGRSVSVVSLGERRQAVEKAIGLDHVSPHTVKRGTGLYVAQYTDLRLSILYFGYGNATVVALSTSNPRYATPSGVHAGGTRAAVTHAYRHLKCDTRKNFCDRDGPRGFATRFGFEKQHHTDRGKDELTVIAVGEARYLTELR